MINFMKKRYSSNSIVFCTLNAELSLSEQTDENKLEFIEYPRDEANLRKLAVEIIKDFEANRANKRSLEFLIIDLSRLINILQLKTI